MVERERMWAREVEMGGTRAETGRMSSRGWRREKSVGRSDGDGDGEEEVVVERSWGERARAKRRPMGRRWMEEMGQGRTTTVWVPESEWMWSLEVVRITKTSSGVEVRIFRDGLEEGEGEEEEKVVDLEGWLD